MRRFHSEVTAMFEKTGRWVRALPLGAALLVGCGGPLVYVARGAAQAPEADVKITAEPHANAAFTTLKVEVEHLAPPERVGSNSTCFVVWTKGDKPKWHRVGALKYDPGSRKALIEGASVPVVSFDLKITGEATDNPDLPSDNLVVTQHVN
jgi:hypothetical protein